MFATRVSVWLDGRFEDYHTSLDICLIKRWVGIDDA